MIGFSRQGEDLMARLQKEVAVDEAANLGTETKEVWLWKKCKGLATETVCWEAGAPELVLSSP